MAKSKTKRARFPIKPKEPAWTPETRAKLVPAPWDDWPTEIQQAAEMIDLGYRLGCGEGIAQAFDYGRIPHAAADDWTDGQKAVARRYTAWREAMDRAGLPLSDVIDMVVFAVHPSQIVRFLLPQPYRSDETGAWALLKDALELWTRA